MATYSIKQMSNPVEVLMYIVFKQHIKTWVLYIIVIVTITNAT